jgi:hypothetical protein
MILRQGILQILTQLRYNVRQEHDFLKMAKMKIKNL